MMCYIPGAYSCLSTVAVSCHLHGAQHSAAAASHRGRRADHPLAQSQT